MACQPKEVRRATSWDEVVEEGIVVNVSIINNS